MDSLEALCPGFHQWFVRNRKSVFLESVIQSARLNSDSTGLYYQSDIEFIHASEKRYQNFKKESIEVTLSNIQKIIQREKNDKMRTLYWSRQLLPVSRIPKIPGSKSFVALLE